MGRICFYGVCLLILCQMMVSSFNYSDSVWSTTSSQYSAHKVVAFYHLFTQKGGAYTSIVNEQLEVLRNSGLLEKLDVVYYTTAGNEATYRLSEAGSKFQHLWDWGEHGVEDETLGLLYRYCAARPMSYVLYFHNKGSFHNTPANVKYRQFLNCFVLTPHCLEALEKHHFDTCGWRISPIPHPHYPGNFWWASCRHVNRLVDPLSPYINQTFIDLTATLSDCIGSKERYFAETWVTSLPQYRPADCMNASLDTSYIYGYVRFPAGVTEQYCPSPNPSDSYSPSSTSTASASLTPERRSRYGYQCDLATTYQYPQLFYESINYMHSLGAPQCVRSLDQDLTKRSLIWYGQPPSFYLDWIARVTNLPVFTKGQAIRPIHSRQIYYYTDKNCLYPIPSLQVFTSLGLDFDNVTVIHDYLIDKYPLCDSL